MSKSPVSSKSSILEIRITPEGWIYLVILAFISVGAVLRNVNLLILMAGMMCTPLIINWRVGVLWLKSLTAQRVLSHRMYAGKLASLQWICRNDARLSAWNVEIRDSLRLASPGSAEDADSAHSATRMFSSGKLARWLGYRTGFANSSNARLSFLNVGAGQTETSTSRLLFSRRGRYQSGPAVLSTKFPFGLIESRILIPAQSFFYVAPALGTLTPVWDRRVESTVAGADAIKRKRSQEEDEFYALRPWRSGDSRKHIHWRTSAKYGQPIVKQHEQQDNRDFAMLLDLYDNRLVTPESASQSLERPGPKHLVSENVSSSISDPSECPTCEQVLSFAATVVLHLKTAVHGRIAIGICGKNNSVCGSRNQSELVNQTMRELAVAIPSRETSLAETLLKLSCSVSSSTPLYVISTRERAEEFDFVFNPTGQKLAAGSIQNEPSISTAATSLPVETIADHRIKNKILAIWPSVNWISVDSPEFGELFSKNLESDQKQVDAIARKWVAADVTS